MKTIIKCVKCQAEVQVSEAQFYKSKGHCKSCYYVRFEKPKLMKKIFKEINKKNKMNITNNNYCLIDGDGSRDLTPCVGCKKLVEDRYLCSEVESEKEYCFSCFHVEKKGINKKIK